MASYVAYFFGNRANDYINNPENKWKDIFLLNLANKIITKSGGDPEEGFGCLVMGLCFLLHIAPPVVVPTAATIYASWTAGNTVYDIQVEKYKIRKEQADSHAKQEIIRQEIAQKYTIGDSKVTLNDVVGFDDLKKAEIPLMVDFLRSPLKYQRHRNVNSYSVLFYGPPGTGKTLLARAIAGETQTPIIKITADDLSSINSNEKLLAIWAIAAEAAQTNKSKSVMIYIDEIDLAIGGEGSRTSLDSSKSRALANLLALLDGIEQGNPYVNILIIMATNIAEHIDPALLRPGRIDKALYIGLPERKARLELLDRLLPGNTTYSIDEIANKTEGLAPAHIVNIVESAQMRAKLEKKEEATREMYLYEIERVQKSGKQKTTPF